MKTDIIKLECEKFGLILSDDTCSKLKTYANMLLEYNKVMNLTAITDPDEIAIKHFLDCLMILKHCDIKKNASLIDVGTGAGFPGMVLKIVRPDISLCLLDSLAKRLNFLRDLSDKLDVCVNLVHARAEDAGKSQLRESFDVATARAVAALSPLCEYCLPFVRVGGMFIAQKGPLAEGEIAASGRAPIVLGGDVPVIIEEQLPDNSERRIVLIKKISLTPEKYPRNPGKISKSPL